MALQIIITDAGRAALVNAQNNGTDPTVIASVGVSATALTPVASATTLPGEIKRISTISGAVVAPDTIHVTVRDETADSYTMRSFALYLADGTLFAIYGQAGPIVDKSAQATMLLAIDVIFADIAASSLTFGDANFLNPPATTTVQGVVELATEAEATAGEDDVRAVTPKGVKAAVTGWLNDRLGTGAPSTFVKGLLSAVSAIAFRAAIGLKSAALKDEGAGNGLDADKLDGQEGSYYANIIDRLGYTPLNVALYTGADVLSKMLTVDGAGSGLDADLLDGQQGSYYTNITARLGYIPASRAGDIFGGTVRVRVGSNGFVEMVPSNGGDTGQVYFSGNDGSRKGFIYAPSSGIMTYGNDSFSGHNFIGGGLRRDGAAVWDAGNDGAGSGLDADMLDGHHAAAFLRLESNTRFQQDRGYLLYTNGLKETWGEIVVNANSAGYWEYPVGFSSWVHPQISVTVVNGEDNASQMSGITSVGLGGIWVYTASNSAVRFYIRIIGV